MTNELHWRGGTTKAARCPLTERGKMTRSDRSTSSDPQGKRSSTARMIRPPVGSTVILTRTKPRRNAGPGMTAMRSNESLAVRADHTNRGDTARRLPDFTYGLGYVRDARACHSRSAGATANVVRCCTTCSNQDRPRGAEHVQCRMSIERDDGLERQERVDRMISEFREARARRAAKPNDGSVVSKPDPDARGPRAVPAAHARPRLR